MQRVRIGLTGLACVFLLVLLAAAFFGLASKERSVGPLASSNAISPAAGDNVVEAPREPLAELGVAPGFSGDTAAANAAAPATAAHGADVPAPR